MKLAAAGNVEIPALLVLEEKGFSVRVAGKKLWVAEKGSDTFFAEGPIELLGVVCVYEVRGEDWPAEDSDTERFLHEFESEI